MRIKPLTRGHLSYNFTFFLSHRWPLNTGLTVQCTCFAFWNIWKLFGVNSTKWTIPTNPRWIVILVFCIHILRDLDVNNLHGLVYSLIWLFWKYKIYLFNTFQFPVCTAHSNIYFNGTGSLNIKQIHGKVPVFFYTIIKTFLRWKV